MVASRDTVEQIIAVVRRHVRGDQLRAIVRDLGRFPATSRSVKRSRGWRPHSTGAKRAVRLPLPHIQST
jgi:hypothetical protein